MQRDLRTQSKASSSSGQNINFTQDITNTEGIYVQKVKPHLPHDKIFTLNRTLPNAEGIYVQKFKPHLPHDKILTLH